MSLDRFFSCPPDVIEYLSNISRSYRYYYLANPKVASSTILYVLQTAEERGAPPDLLALHDRFQSPLESFANFDAETVLRGSEFFKFTYVRNPFTRILSCYLDKMVKNGDERRKLTPKLGFTSNYRPTFREFLEAVHAQPDECRDIHWATQTYLIQMDSIPYDFIGRFESFGSSFPKVLDRIGIPKEYLTVTDKGSRHPTNSSSRLDEYIGEEEKKIILAIYESDFKALAYGIDMPIART